MRRERRLDDNRPKYTSSMGYGDKADFVRLNEKFDKAVKEGKLPPKIRK